MRRSCRSPRPCHVAPEWGRARAAVRRCPHAASPDLNELRAFCAAAELGTVGRAASGCTSPSRRCPSGSAALERKVGARLLDRSPQGVALTPPGRRLYRHARTLVETADRVGEVMLGIRDADDVVRLASSHSATEAFAAAMLAEMRGHELTVELVTANSHGRPRRSSPTAAPTSASPRRGPATRRTRACSETVLADDAIVCAVPPGHPWAGTPRVAAERFLATPMVVRDPSSNARWTVDAVLAARGLEAAAPLAEAATPRAAIAEARAQRAPRPAQPSHRRADRLRRRSRSRASPSRAATCSSRPRTASRPATSASSWT